MDTSIVQGANINGSSASVESIPEKLRIKRQKNRAALKLKRAKRLEEGLPSPPKNPLGLLASFYCKICSLKLDSQSTFDLHLAGAKHKKRSRVPLKCEVCNMSFVSEKVLEGHLVGMKHKKKAKAANDPPIYCDVCKLVLPNQTLYDIHITGQKHMRKVSQKSCDACQLKFKTDDELAKHVDGQKHQKKMKVIELTAFLAQDDSGFVKDYSNEGYTCSACDKSFLPCAFITIPTHILSGKHETNVAMQHGELYVPPKKRLKTDMDIED